MMLRPEGSQDDEGFFYLSLSLSEEVMEVSAEYVEMLRPLQVGRYPDSPGPICVILQTDH